METCNTCPFYVAGEVADDKKESENGACHFAPPQVTTVLTVQKVQGTVANPEGGMVQVPAAITQWPTVVGRRDWCGEHPAFAEDDPPEVVES